jgi:glycerol-3-phosphate dehydrogenase (NAD(P)+)
MKFLVLGLGAWGSALGQVLSDNGHLVTIWAKDPAAVEEFNSKHTVLKYFDSDVIFSSGIKAVSSLKEGIKDQDAFVIAVPSKAYREVLASLAPLIEKKMHIVSVGKGFDPSTFERLSDLIREEVPSEDRYPVVSLLGPSFAKETVKKSLTALTAVSQDEKEAEIIQDAFSNSYFRVYTSLDEIGAEYAAALKNVIALASGIITGLGYKDNSRAALVTRGLAEMMRFGVAKGGKMETYLGLTGLGDLMLTCTSLTSRNFSSGLEIGKENSAVKFLKENKATVEGLVTAKVMHEEARQMKIDMPIVNAVYDVIYQGKTPSEVVKSLMERSLKSEF